VRDGLPGLPAAAAHHRELSASRASSAVSFARGTLVFLDPGDFEAALNAAAAIGDDTLQRETQGQVVPDSFTHGSSAQRVRWLKRGFETGDVQACDTFRASQL